MLQYDGSQQSAEGILGYLINQRKPIVLDIQTQMVTDKMDLNDTPAGRVLNADICAEQKEFEEKLKRVKIEMQYREKVQRMEEDRRRLNVDLEQLKLEEAEKARVNEKSGKEMGRKMRWLLRGLGVAAAWTATVLLAGALGPTSAAGLGVLQAGLQVSKRA
ncbi:hypothetical protein GP486_008269 [Trichoglossum hirsutum]|uniref:Uncharacterized protein n=1 Tax=Trichoglossum hirsutum TaxID=265104 RepID=A0A9P8IEA8_9PEZI|nr:hypothetical protein GP486_008269 [Trichoglossum hirsutum]